VNCPILFLNGSNDFAYPLDSYRKSYRLVREDLRRVSVVIGLRHGHIWTFGEVDQFVDSVMRHGTPLPHLRKLTLHGDRVTAAVDSPTPLKEAALHYTTDTTVEWQKRRWQTEPAELRNGAITTRLPEQRPLVCYFSITDERGLRVSTEHEEFETDSH
jgi:hypothetical protein